MPGNHYQIVTTAEIGTQSERVDTLFKQLAPSKQYEVLSGESEIEMHYQRNHT
jgi:hypothetical protein